MFSSRIISRSPRIYLQYRFMSLRNFQISQRLLINNYKYSCLSLNNNLFNNNINNNMIINYSLRSYGTSKDAIIKAFNLADVGEGIAECELLKWYVKEGQEIQQFDMICEVQSDKATAEITSPYDGLVTKLYYNIGDMAKVGDPLIDIKMEGSNDDNNTKTESKKEESSVLEEKESLNDDNHHYQNLNTKSGIIKVLATPAVRRIAKENNIKLSDVSGSGADGRILKHDILAFIDGDSVSNKDNIKQQQQQQSDTSSSISQEQQTKPENIYQLEDYEIPIKGITKIMVKSMTAACQVPHFGYCDEIIMNDLKTLREQMKPLAQQQNIKLSFLPFIIKSCSLALKQYPSLNAYTNTDCTAITVKGSHNIGIAMDTPSGLIVPNIKNVQDLSILDIAKELNTLQDLASKGKLEKHHLEGGTFTLSNVGAIGGTYASPVLFLPQVAIGALGKIQKLPRYDTNDNIYPAHTMNISWSADHRVVDGATMARFSNLMKSFIENPNTMMLSMK